MQTMFDLVKKYTLLMVLCVILFAVYFFRLNQYLDFAIIQQHHSALLRWSSEHYSLAVSIYILLFSFLIACTIPCATFFTIVGGMIFGLPAFIYAEFSTIFGGFILFHAVRTAFGAQLAAQSAKHWIKRIEQGFRKNAFHYLLMLRLVPVFPCWISNIGSGILNVPQSTFLAATTIGIMPATLVYILAGRGLNVLLAEDRPVNTALLLKPAILIPLISLAFLSLLPIFYKWVKQNRKKR